MTVPRRRLVVLSTIQICASIAACGDDKLSSRDGFGWLDGADADLDSASGPDMHQGADGAGAPLPADATCGQNVAVTRVAPWPGGGLQLHVSLMADATRAADPAQAGTPFLRAADGTVVPLTMQPVVASTRIGIALVRGASDDADARTAQHAIAVVSSAAELRADVVVWDVAASAPRVLVEPTTDAARLGAAINAWRSARPSGFGQDQATLSLGVLAARDQLARVGGPDGPADRVLVVVRDGGATVPDGQPAVGVDGVRVRHVDVAAVSADEAALARTRALTARPGFARIGACAESGSAGPYSLVWGTAECPVTWPDGEARLAAVSCEAAAAAADAFPWGDTVELVMTAAEETIWQERRAASSRDDFDLAVKFDAGEALRATARLRGHSSLGCERKSYTVNVKGSDPHRLMPGAASDRFYLIAMCLDRGYYNQLFADRLGQRVGFFPLAFRVVRLVAAGVDQGAYMLLEKADEALVQDMVQPWTVIRRRFDPEDELPDIDWVSDTVTDAQALEFWNELNAIARDGDVTTMPAELGARFDVDTYLRWLGFNAFMGNGDFVDEVIFHGGVEGSGDARRPFLRVVGWDPDDLFSACHHGGRFAIEDPHELLFCAEGDLDQAVIRSPEIYARFVQHLEAIMDELPASVLEAAMVATRESLLAIVDNDTTASAMVELKAEFPETATAAGFDTVVTGMMDALLQKAEASRETLRTRIARWREATAQ